MAQLRTALRAYAADGYPSAAVVDRVNRLMWQLGPLAMTTLAYVVLDPANESLELVSAGHPPLLVVNADGAAAFLEPQAASRSARQPPATRRRPRLPTGATVVLYTDGARRGPRRVDRRRASSGCARSPTGAPTSRRCVDGARAAGARRRRRTTSRSSPRASRRCSEHLADALAGDAGKPRPVRQLLRRWLRRARAPTDDETYDIVVAVPGGVRERDRARVRPGAGRVRGRGDVEGGRVIVTVRDRGGWRPPRGRDRGRGMPLMRALMDTVEVRQDEEGTAVVLQRALKAAAA